MIRAIGVIDTSKYTGVMVKGQPASVAMRGMTVPVAAGPVVPWTPQSIGMNWWDPNEAYTGTEASVTAIPNQLEGGPSLTYVGNQPLTVVNIDGKNWLRTPASNAQQRLIQDSLASGISTEPNAPFTVALAFSLHALSPITSTLWSVASGPAESLSRINFGLTSGLIRLFGLDAAGEISGIASNAPLLSGDQKLTLIISARPNGTVSVMFNGMLVNDNSVWTRPAIPDLDQFSFGLLRQGTSNAQVTFGDYGAIGWMNRAATDSECRALADLMYREYN